MARKEKSTVDGESHWEEGGGLVEGLAGSKTVAEESQWSEVSSELVVDNPAEVQEPCVTTQIELSIEPKEEIDDSDEGAHYSPRRNWKWIR